MEMEFSRLNPVDLNAVDDLMKRHGQTLGFLPAEALRDYIAKGCVLGAKHESGQLMGYLLYGSSTDFFGSFNSVYRRRHEAKVSRGNSCKC